MDFGERLKTIRKERGLTQHQLAQMVGIAASTLTNYEKGNREPDVDKIKKLAGALNVSADHLLMGDSIKKMPSPTMEESTIHKEILEYIENADEEELHELTLLFSFLLYKRKEREGSDR